MELTEQEKKEKIIEYSNRHQFWASQVLSQFGFSINLFLTLGLGFIGFLVSKIDNYNNLSFDFNRNIDWKLLGYFISLVLAFLSVTYGFISVISRLYDLRITRHIILIRKRTTKKLGRLLSDELIEETKKYLIPLLIKLSKEKTDYIIEKDFNDYTSLAPKFKILRTRAKIFGDLSWKTHKRQIFFLIISSIIYGINAIIKNS